MNKRNTYHSTIKLAYALDIQRQWLPKEFLTAIPRSTSHGWKSEIKEKFIGYEFASGINDNVEELKLIFSDQVSKEKQLFIAYTRIKIALFEIIGKETIQEAFKEHFRKLVKVIDSSKSSVQGGVKTLCSFLEIKTQTFRYWSTVSKHTCTKSSIGLCLKKVPNQATKEEVSIMKRLLSRKRFDHWPICSVWGYAIRKGHVSMSLNTWYRYNQRFQFRKAIIKGKFKKVYLLDWNAVFHILPVLETLQIVASKGRNRSWNY